MITHGVTIEYGNGKYSVRGYETKEEAAEAMADILIGIGYTFPKPYHFWRWNEHKPSKLLREALERRGLK